MSSPSLKPASPRHWPAIASALLAIGLYAVTLAGSYVYDDEFIARDDPRVREPGAWVQYFHQSYYGTVASDAPLWRPLASLSYALEYHLFGGRALPAHLINVLLHGLVSALVALLAMRLSGSSRVSLAAGLLFAAHPVHVEAVAGIVGRAELLCTLGIVSAILLFLRRPITGRRATLIAGCFLLAILSKEHGLLLLLMLPATLAGMGRLTFPERKRVALWFLTLCICTLAYTTWRERIAPFEWEKTFFDWTVNPLFRSRGIDRVLLPFSILGRYVTLLVAPVSLSPDYGANVIGYQLRGSDLFFYVGVASLLVYFIVLIVALRRRLKIVALTLIWMGFSYALISNSLLLIGTAVAERLMYLTSVFFVILLAMALNRLPGRTMCLLLGIVVAGAGWRTVTYARQWNDSLRLFERTRAAHPESVKLWLMDAKALIDRGRLEEAEGRLAVARRLVPESVEAWKMSARLAHDQGRDKDAAEFARRVFELEMNPPHMR